MSLRRLWVPVVLLAIWAVLLHGAASGASYPTRPVTLIVPWPAGGAVDQAARALSDAVKTSFPQPISVVQRPGGGGSIGAAEVLRAKPDGYTIGMTGPATLTLLPQMHDLPYKTLNDFEPVMNVLEWSYVFLVHSEAPWRTLQEVLQFAEQRPNQLRVGNGGIGTLGHMNLELLKEKAGVQWISVPFSQGDPEGVTALLGKHVDVFPAVVTLAVPQIRAGRLRGLAYFADARHPLIPDIPTARELGYDAALVPYNSLFGPKGMPREAITMLNDGLRKGLETDSYKKFAQEQGFVIRYLGPVELRARLEKDYVLYGEMIKKLGLKAGK